MNQAGSPNADNEKIEHTALLMATGHRYLFFVVLTSCWLSPPLYGADSPFRLTDPGTLPLLLLAQDTNTIPDHLTLQQNKAKIGKIIIKRENVFDPSKPEEDIALFRLANKLHIVTQESVIRDQLLFKTGDDYSLRTLQESARLLRTNKYLYDASIKPIAYHQDTNTVDVEVDTRDTWTFTGSVHFSREGGSNKISSEIQESNLLGYGKDLKFKASSNIDRTESLFEYNDRHVWGTYNQLALAYNSKSDGITKSIDIERPFFSLTTQWSLGASAYTDQRRDPIYQFGKTVSAFDHYSQDFSYFWGLSQHQHDNLVYRWRFGFDKTIDRFTPADTYPDAELPDDRDFRYPWVGLEVYEDRMIRTTHIHQIRRTEDLNLGNEIYAKLGWSDKVFTAKDEAVIFSLSANTPFQLTDKQLLLFRPYTSGRITHGAAKNTTVGFSTKYYRPNFPQQVFYMAFSAEYVRNPDLDNQLLLGGDTGLRGYPLRFQTGDRKYLFTVEQRFYTSWHLFELAYVGAVAFFDIGRAWTPNEPATVNTGTLRDAGIGLRMASSRGSRGVVFHFDLAFPLDGGPDIGKSQLVITTKESF